MNRADIIKTFPNATEDQITQLLNMHHVEVEEEKAKNKDLKSTSKDLEEARKEIEELRAKVDNNAPEDWQSQLDKLTEQNNKAQQTIKNMEMKTSLLGQGFNEADVDEYIKAFNEGGDIASILGKMKENAISAHDKARLENTPDPKGSSSNPSEEKSAAEKLATDIFSGSQSDTQTDILSKYK